MKQSTQLSRNAAAFSSPSSRPLRARWCIGDAGRGRSCMSIFLDEAPTNAAEAGAAHAFVLQHARRSSPRVYAARGMLNLSTVLTASGSTG